MYEKIISSIDLFYMNSLTKIEVFWPKIIWALAVIILWIFISIVTYKFVIYLFKRFKIIELIDKLDIDFWEENEKWDKEKKKQKFSDVIAKKIEIDKVVWKAVAYYLFLVFFRISIKIIWIDDVENFMGDLLRYLPSLFIAFIIWFFWIRFANFIYDIVYHTLDYTKQKTAKIIASWAKVIILFFTLMAVLSKIWIATEITYTILIWFISMLSIAWWLAFWLGWKEIAKEILESFRK